MSIKENSDPTSKEDLEKQKLSNEIELQRIQISNQKEFKGWGKRLAHSFEPFKEWGQTMATLFLGVVGIIFTITNNSNQEKFSKVTMLTQLMANREKSETDFRQYMFSPLITQILNDSLQLEKRYTILQIFQNNFNDLFNSRAMFDVLDDKAQEKMSGVDSAMGGKIHEKLISLARKTNEDQELLIGGEQVIKDSLAQGVPFDTLIGDRNEIHHIIIEVTEITEMSVKVTIKLNPNTDESIELNNGKPIEISYFDSPLTDNILLPDKHRVAVTLEDIHTADKPYKAKLKIIHFPAEFITTGYRPSVKFAKEMLEK